MNRVGCYEFFLQPPLLLDQAPQPKFSKVFPEQIINKVNQTKTNSHLGIINKQAIINAEGLKPQNRILGSGHVAVTVKANRALYPLLSTMQAGYEQSRVRNCDWYGRQCD